MRIQYWLIVPIRSRPGCVDPVEPSSPSAHDLISMNLTNRSVIA